MRRNLLTEWLGGKADVVLSDMAANATGHKKTDHLRIVGLVELAADFACQALAPGGAFLAKVLQGGTENELLARLKRDFAVVRHVKPQASRADSSELYVLATGFQRPARNLERVRLRRIRSGKKYSKAFQRERAGDASTRLAGRTVIPRRHRAAGAGRSRPS